MFSKREIKTPSPLQHARVFSTPQEVIRIIEDDTLEHNPDELISLVESRYPDPSVRYLAYCYLFKSASLEKLQELAEYMDFNFVDDCGNSAVLFAAQFGREDVFNWLATDLKLPIDTKNLYGSNVVLKTIGSGNVKLLQALIERYKQSLEVQDIDGVGPVLKAITFGNEEMLDVLTKDREAEGYELSMNTTDSLGRGPVLTAVACGQFDMLTLLLNDDYNQSIKEVDTADEANAVLIAIIENQYEMLLHLLAPKSSGGGGLLLDVRDKAGYDPVLTAAAYGQLAMLQKLVKPIRKGGQHGLSLNKLNIFGDNILFVATINGQLEVLQFLTKPVVEDGCGLEIDNAEPFLQSARENENYHVFLWIFEYEFRKQLKTKSLTDVLDWAKSIIPVDGLNDKLIDLYKELLEFQVSLLDSSTHIERLVSELDELNNGSGRLALAGYYQKDLNTVDAYETYLEIYTDDACNPEIHDEAGVAVAHLILNGGIVLVEGNFDKKQTKARENLSEEQRIEEGKNQDIMLWRAIYAYEYLHLNTALTAQDLRKRCDFIMSGCVVDVDKQVYDWSIDALNHFFNFYRKRNRELLTEDAYVNATAKLIQVERANRATKRKNPDDQKKDEEELQVEQDAKKPRYTTRSSNFKG